MQAGWLDIITAIGSVLSGIGLIATAISIWLLKRQTVATERTADLAVFQSIVALGTSINDMNIERPELHKQLFGDAAPAIDCTIYQDQFASPMVDPKVKTDFRRV